MKGEKPELDNIQMLFDLLTLLACLREIMEVGQKVALNQMNEDAAWNQVLETAENSIASLGSKDYVKGNNHATQAI